MELCLEHIKESNSAHFAGCIYFSCADVAPQEPFEVAFEKKTGYSWGTVTGARAPPITPICCATATNMRRAQEGWGLPGGLCASMSCSCLSRCVLVLLAGWPPSYHALTQGVESQFAALYHSIKSVQKIGASWCLLAAAMYGDKQSVSETFE